MQTLTATLIETDGLQRYYKLSHKITKGLFRLTGRVVDIPDEIEAEKPWLKKGYEDIMPVGGCDIVCISDAHTHTERIVFAGMQYEREGRVITSRTRVQIEGRHTMMIHGGDPSTIKPDHVYLRLLARHNGMQFLQS